MEPPMTGGPQTTPQLGSRTSSGSGRSSHRSLPHDRQVSQIEKSVGHLLVATKQLLETLTQWSRQQATETEVSDVYVRLGYEFNLACRAFQSIGVDTSDLGPVPDMLRTILEDTLSQEALPESLERYLPRIRDIIINLLQGLKRKQARIRSRQPPRELRAGPPRRESSGSVDVTDPASASAHPPDDAAFVSTSPPPPRSPEPGMRGAYPDVGAVRHASSGERFGGSFAEREASRRENPRWGANSPQSSMSNMASAVSAPTPDARPSARHPAPHGLPHAPPPPPPPPKQNDAIGLLQRSGELERRASRRFSAYQIQKHLGTPPSGVPVLPSPQHPPVANRGREVRESMNAVRLRGSYLSRQRPPADPNKRSFDRGRGEEEQHVAPRIRGSGDSIPTTQPSGERLRRTPEGDPLMGSQRKSPSLVHQPEPGEPPAEVPPQPNGVKEPPAPVHTRQSSDEQPPPPPSKELTLFLQYRSKIKKYVLPDGAADLTIGRLQLAFIEKFAWNTHSNGADLPEIYIQDPVSGIRHELEDLTDVKDRSVLVLNVEPLDEVKKHFDEQVSGVRTLLESVKSLVENQGSSLQHLNDHQQEAAKEIARFAVQSPPVQDGARRSLSSADARLHARSPSNAAKLDGIDEVRTLRRDLAVLRQTYTTFSSDITASMKTIRKKAESVKGVAADVSTPSYEGDAGRAHINAGKKTLADESEKLVARVDDLQDLVEDLRKDVVTRGVRPLPRQLEAVGRDIGAVTKELKKMQEFLKKEKPVWTKIWEKELQMVCEERDQLTMQEDLAIDLEDDLEKASQTFALVEQATRQQNNQSNTNNAVGARSVSRGIPVDPVADLSKAKDSVLGEVKALQPNHQNRLDAIERAEKARQRELESRRVGKFQKELGNFVQEGKLKKSGGVEEAERMREAKDEQARRDVWEQERARKQSLEGGEEKPAGAGDEASGVQEQPGEDVSAPAEEKGDEKPERKYEPPSVEDEDAPEQKGEEEGPVDAQDVAEEQKEEPASEA